MSELTVSRWRADTMKYNEIKQPCLYGYQIENYVWQQVEKAAVKGFLAGALVMCIIWMIVLGV